MTTDAENWNLATRIETYRPGALIYCPLQAARLWLTTLGLSLCLPCMGTRSRGGEVGGLGQGASSLEQFKHFLSSPPPIEILVFRQKLRSDLNSPQEYDGTFSGSTNFAIFKARTQTNAVLLLQSSDNSFELNYLPGCRLVSIFDREHWIVEPHKYIETCSATPGSFHNPVTTSVAFSLANLNQVLQGGLMHVRPGSIIWNRNQFLVEDVPTPYKLRFRVEGQVSEKEGVATELLVKYSTGTSSTDVNGEWRIQYSYERTLDTEYFPCRIKAFALRNHVEIEMDDFEILKLKLATQTLPRDAYVQQQALTKSLLPLRIYTNDSMYDVLPNGKLARVYRDSVLTNRGDYSNSRQLALCALVGANVLFFARIARSRMQNGKENK